MRSKARECSTSEEVEVKGGLIKDDWTPQEADEWTIHDLLASLFSALSYIGVAVGLAGALLLQWWGFVVLVASLACIYFMYKIIDPKLRAMSKAFEEKEKEYIERADRATRWEG